MRLSPLMLFFVIILGCFAAPHREFSPIITAARSGDVLEIAAEVAHGADPNAIDDRNGWTPLFHAIHRNQIHSDEALLAHGANPNRTATFGRRGVTPLMLAAGYGYTPIVELLLKRGADPAIVDQGGERAVDYALTGTTDIDRFTFLDCQDDTVRASPSVSAVSGASNGRW